MVSAVGSFVGGTVSIVGLMFIAPPLAQVMIAIGPSVEVVLMLLALSVIAVVSAGSRVKTVVMVALGLLLGTIGLDNLTGVARFTFGNTSMAAGLSFTSLAIGLFGVSEILINLEKTDTIKAIQPKLKDLVPRWNDLRDSAPAVGRASVIGFIFGIIPGVSHVVSTFVSYAVEKRLSAHPERFGHGAIEGVAGPETANNAVTGTAMIPLLALGIPSIPATAILLSALTIHGVQPGPLLLTDHPEVFWSLVASMYIGNVILLILNLPLVGIFVNLLRIPYAWLVPIILIVSVIGVYSVNFSAADIWIMVISGGAGYILRKFGYEMAPLLAGARARRPPGDELSPGAYHVERQLCDLRGSRIDHRADLRVRPRRDGSSAGMGVWISQVDCRRGGGRMNEAAAATAKLAPAQEARPLRVAVVGIGWWSDVLADAARRSGAVEIASCFTRSDDKRGAFAAKYGCRAATSFEEILADRDIEAIVNTTPNGAHLETTRQAAQAGKHVFLDKPIANTVAEGSEIARVCEAAGIVLALGYQRRRERQFRWIKAEIDAGRFGRLVQADANISRDRLGKIDLSSWRYQASGMPGGVMLQIGIHYVDVLEMLIGKVARVSGVAAQLVLPGDNPDVAAMILEHENGAVSTLGASYASASEYYMMNVYGKEASAYYDAFSGLRHLRRGDGAPRAVAVAANDTIREELEEFVACIRHGGRPETDGWWGARNLAVVMAGILSAREGHAVEVESLLSGAP